MEEENHCNDDEISGGMVPKICSVRRRRCRIPNLLRPVYDEAMDTRLGNSGL